MIVRFNFELKTEYFGQGRLFILRKQVLQVFYFLLAVYKTGMGRKGQERWDVWGDLGLGDIKYGRRERQIQGCGDIND